MSGMAEVRGPCRPGDSSRARALSVPPTEVPAVELARPGDMLPPMLKLVARWLGKFDMELVDGVTWR